MVVMMMVGAIPSIETGDGVCWERMLGAWRYNRKLTCFQVTYNNLRLRSSDAGGPEIIDDTARLYTELL